MRRPAELADRSHPVELVAAVDEQFGVTGECGGIAAYVGNSFDARWRDRSHLFFRPGPRRVENHGFEQETSWADEYKRILKLFEDNLKTHDARRAS